MVKLTILLLLLTLTSTAQQLKLRLNFPAPRQGDKIEVSVILDKPGMTYPVDGELKFYHYTNDTGLVTIGPITLKINDTIYTSDSLQVRVYEKLPNQDRGLWSKIVKVNGVEYLILEQRMTYKKSESYSNNTYTSTTTGEGEFAELAYYTINEPGLKITFHRSESFDQYIVDKDGKKTPVKYQVTVYKIEKDKKFNSKFKVDKQYFKNLPEGVKLPEIIIQP